ncbi:hypothetical protein [Fimbriimonas ginsengisoli]|uniref:Uncharacterized protein n=1 Tax=Fimbriimonas ginsengisoli Gsoil 348 TaxID=661478 RepID=A0A068NN36_FIMGI|nr:hypothetical protein [Fimbriimonas ginsengisoli]AIE84876.1 hypothetical protein OP10G_1508 [Fimbriimonas ginsengisoli Gsoil 348]
MPKKSYEATFYYQVTIVREGTIEIDVPAGAPADYNPFDGKEIGEVIDQYESSLGEPEMIVDDENPEGERLMDVLLHDPESGEVVRVTRHEGGPNLVAAEVELDEDEE